MAFCICQEENKNYLHLFFDREYCIKQHTICHVIVNHDYAVIANQCA